MTDEPRTAPAAQRNLPFILEMLASHAPSMGEALEIASGTGQQIVAFAAAHPGLMWQASDRDPANIGSITAWARQAALPNLRPPVVLDAAKPGWSKTHSGKSLILIINLLHLISDPAAASVVSEAALALAPQGKLMIYGPFLRDGRTTSDGDANFHATLRAQDPAIGYKDVSWLTAAMTRAGLQVGQHAMPANNLMVIGHKGGSGGNPT